MTEYDYQSLDDAVCGVEMTAQGSPVEDLHDPWQHVRAVANGYTMETTAFYDHWICEQVVYERPEYGEDDALERLLTDLAEQVGTTEDIERVARKLWPRENGDEG